MKNQINIVVSHLGGKGGTEQAIIMLANGLSERNYDVRLFVVEDDYSDNTHWYAGFHEGIQIKRFPVVHKLQKLGVLAKLSRNLKGIVLVLNTRVLRILDILRGHQKSKYILVSWIHNSIFSRPGFKNLRCADYHLAISTGIQNQLESLKIHSNQIFVVYNPATQQNTTIAKTEVGTIPKFLYIGRIENGQKNIKGMLDIFSDLSVPFSVTIVGDGPDFTAMKEYSIEKGLSKKVRWLGQVDEPWTKISEADGLMLASNFEGFPMVLLEAMSRGIPCIAYDCPTGPGDIIQEGINGYLIPFKNAGAFGEKLKRMALRENQVADPQAIKKSIAKFSYDRYMNRVIFALNRIETEEM